MCWDTSPHERQVPFPQHASVLTHIQTQSPAPQLDRAAGLSAALITHRVPYWQVRGCGHMSTRGRARVHHHLRYKK